MSYFVVRNYSHTDKQYLLKVLSRNMVSLQSATDWADSTKKIDIDQAKTNRRKKEITNTDYFVVQQVEENVELKAEHFLRRGWKVTFTNDYITIVCKIEKPFPPVGNIHIFEGRGRSMNEAFDDCRFKIWEFEVTIPEGWRRLEKTEFVKTTDRKFDGYYWVKAIDHDDLWNIEYRDYKFLFIRKI